MSDYYQVYVETFKGEIPVGFRFDCQEALFPFAEAINRAILKGTEKDYKSARIVKVLGE